MLIFNKYRLNGIKKSRGFSEKSRDFFSVYAGQGLHNFFFWKKKQAETLCFCLLD
jgi:hypothetical protein